MLEILKKFLRIVFLSKDKVDLIDIRNLVLDFLDKKLKLEVPLRKQDLNKIETGINFLGYIILDKKLKIKNATIRRFKKLQKNKEKSDLIHSLMSFKGHCDLSNPNLIKSITNSILIGSNKIFKYKKNFKYYYEAGRWEEVRLFPSTQILIY